MGAEQSKSKGKEQEEGPLDYYELLQVDIEATPEEIKVRLCLLARSKLTTEIIQATCSEFPQLGES